MKNKTTTHGTARECCSDLNCEHGLRNNYFEGKRLTADSFRVEQKYSLERRRLLNRAIHGWGVVYGYAVIPTASAKSTGPGRLWIGPGLALDKCGRELLQTERPIEFNELTVLDEKGMPIDRESAVSQIPSSDGGGDGPQQDVCWRLSVHYAEQRTGLVKIKDQCQCEYDEWDRTCETVRYSLQRINCDECCDDFECELKCDCASGPCCDEPDPKQQPAPQASAEVETADHEARDHVEPIVDRGQGRKTHKRGGCRCLCEHLTLLNPGADCGPLCEVEEPCGSVWVDTRNGVRLACVKLVRDDCDRLKFEVTDDCGPRRLVKRNDLLFDLIRGCDLTRIEDIGWKSWHRQSMPIEFDKFALAFGDEADEKGGYVTKDFWVKFSRPVRRDTVRRDCFVMTIIFSEPDDTWWETLRVPIVRVDVAEDAELIDHATIVVDGPWLRDTIKGAASLFQGRVTRVELEVRGDFIVDCNGQTVDANAHGRSPVPTGNGTPGGTYLSTFLVGPAPSPSRPPSYYSEDKGVS